MNQIETINELVFPQDTAERKRWFTSASFSHPAKMHLSLQMYLIGRYTKKGDTICDPMTGSGTILVACALGRNVICIELEGKFVQMQKDNWEKIKSLGPMLGYKMGEAVILQGDARNLPEVLADCAMFSPPYSNEHSSSLSEKTIRQAEKIHKRKYTRHSFTGGEDYGSSKDNISNLPYGSIPVVISSPPYAEAEAQVSADKFADPEKFAETSSKRFREGKKKGNFASKEAILRGMEKTQKGCGENPNNISKLPYGKADVVCTSPPYEGSLSRDRSQEESHNPEKEKKLAGGSVNIAKGYQADTDLDPSIKRLREHGRTDDKVGGPYGRSLGHPYSGAVENIGNLKSESYLQAMLVVYQNCHRVLKAEGLMILVVKNFIRDKKIIPLDLDTIKLCEQAGFALIERLKRKLTQQSFWRRIYMQKFPDVPPIEFEDILVFSKNAASRARELMAMKEK